MASAKSEDYIGTELELFAEAHAWKRYFASMIAPHIRGKVAEVGAGLGSTTIVLCQPDDPHPWICIEPDRAMAKHLSGACRSGALPSRCQVHCGTLAEMPETATFDTVVYIDVLEHIEDDSAELARASARLKPGGRVVVLSPAWPHLYSEFDRSIGHFRRYTKSSLAGIEVQGIRHERSFYLDSAGYFASLANRILLRQSLPTPGQIKFWDRFIIPASRHLDAVLCRSVGRTVICVWQRS